MQLVSHIPKLPRRKADDHKGSFGHVLGLGGALGMSGALALAGRAAARGGAGLVSLACPAPSQPIVAGLVAEALTIPLPARGDGRIDPEPAADVLTRQAGRWTVLAAGPGWGTGDSAFAAASVALMRQAAKLVDGPAVIDADGLNLLAETGDLASGDWPGLVITPHPGELGRLLGRSAAEIQADRHGAVVEAVKRFSGPSHDHHPVVVLKGRETIVADTLHVYVNATGNPGMATGGTGDVLTGLLAAMLAQGMERFKAAVLAVYLHGRAGDIAAERLGQVSLVAGDLVDCLPLAIMEHQSHK